MCCNNNSNCIKELVENIIELQNIDIETKNFHGCDKPYLGPTKINVCYNTRPVSFYNCSTGKIWEMPYIKEPKNGKSSIFRIESIDDNCIKCRVLIPSLSGIDKYLSTDSFFLINLNCISAIKCLPDTYLECE